MSVVAVVTGAGRGIGAATAIELAARGAKVVLASRTEKELVEVASAIARDGGTALPVRCDVTREEEVARLFREARERLGAVTLLVNNAGTVAQGELATLSLDAWRTNIETNLTSTFLCSRAALADMLPAGRGRIVNVASVSGVTNVPKFPGFVGYAAAKAGVIAFTEALAAEVGPRGVKVFCVSPAAVETALLARVAPGLKADMKPTDIARIIAILATEDATAASGTNVVAWGR
ncbi:MAG: SDR family NAD(P)-dependent oxidoreductase [Planctomycetota bacterium]